MIQASTHCAKSLINLGDFKNFLLLYFHFIICKMKMAANASLTFVLTCFIYIFVYILICCKERIQLNNHYQGRSLYGLIQDQNI